MRLLQRIKCRLGYHRLVVIGRCGLASDHIGCVDCGRQWGMNHSTRTIIPWREVSSFHRANGYNERAALYAWSIVRGRLLARTWRP